MSNLVTCTCTSTYHRHSVLESASADIAIFLIKNVLRIGLYLYQKRKKEDTRKEAELTRSEVVSSFITKTRPCNILLYFHGCKKDNFQMKNCDIFLIFAQNIDRR